MDSAKWHIAADDLTGAGDAGAPFAARGLTTHLWLRPGSSDAPIQVFDLASRNIAAEDAYRRVRECFEKAAPGARTFKKLDSTLKGNIAAELRATHDATGLPVLLAPAHPAMGRRILDGKLLLDGTVMPVSAVLDGIGPGEIAWRRPGEPLVAHPHRWLTVCDAATVEDLASIAERCDGFVPAGTGGLARALAARIPEIARSPREVRARAGRALLVIGSDNPKTSEQVERVRRSEWGARCDVVYAPRSGENDAAVRAALNQNPALLILSGGDTAQRVLEDMLQAPSIVLAGEVVPGVPWGLLPDGLPVATKAGGFGTPDTLIEAMKIFFFLESSL